jgi:hypothetical protein
MRGVTILKAEDDKTKLLNPHTLMAYSGEAGDTGMPHDGLIDEKENMDLTTRGVQFSSRNIYKPTSDSTACVITPVGNYRLLPWHRSFGRSSRSLSEAGQAGPMQIF